ncbi:MAG: hypothetical protein P8X51_18325, partial [Maritimibacter sp.]
TGVASSNMISRISMATLLAANLGEGKRQAVAGMWPRMGPRLNFISLSNAFPLKDSKNTHNLLGSFRFCVWELSECQ